MTAMETAFRKAKNHKVTRPADAPQTVNLSAKLMAAVLKKTKPSRHYRVIRTVMDINAAHILGTFKDGDVTPGVLRKTFSRLGQWLCQVEKAAGIKLEKDLFEKSTYLHFEQLTGIDMTPMAGLISTKQATLLVKHSTNPETDSKKLTKGFAATAPATKNIRTSSGNLEQKLAYAIRKAMIAGYKEMRINTGVH